MSRHSCPVDVPGRWPLLSRYICSRRVCTESLSRRNNFDVRLSPSERSIALPFRHTHSRVIYCLWYSISQERGKEIQSLKESQSRLFYRFNRTYTYTIYVTSTHYYIYNIITSILYAHMYINFHRTMSYRIRCISLILRTSRCFFV